MLVQRLADICMYLEALAQSLGSSLRIKIQILHLQNLDPESKIKLWIHDEKAPHDAEALPKSCGQQCVMGLCYCDCKKGKLFAGGALCVVRRCLWELMWSGLQL